MTPALIWLSGFLSWLGLCLLLWAILRRASERRTPRPKISDGLMHQRMGRAKRQCLMQEDGQPLMWVDEVEKVEPPLSEEKWRGFLENMAGPEPHQWTAKTERKP